MNCVKPKFILELIKEIKKETKKPIVVYPNGGETWNTKTKVWELEKDQGGCDTSLVNNFLNYYKAGAQIIGGCCRVRPSTIGKIR